MATDKKESVKIYIYQIEPIVLLEDTQKEEQTIVNVYKELLRQVEFDFQILICNRAFDVNGYIAAMMQSQSYKRVKNISMRESYIKDLKIKLEEEQMYEALYYVVVSFKSDKKIDTSMIDQIIAKLTQLGNKVTRIEKKEALQDILYTTIHKGYERRIENDHGRNGPIPQLY